MVQRYQQVYQQMRAQALLQKTSSLKEGLLKTTVIISVFCLSFSCVWIQSSQAQAQTLLQSLQQQRQHDTIPLFTGKTLQSSSVTLSELLVWRYYAGDNPNQRTKEQRAAATTGWASVDFDDSQWTSTTSTVFLMNYIKPEEWQGIGWFRAQFRLDSAARSMDLCLDMSQRGASEIYLDGRFVAALGSPSAVRHEEQTMRPYGTNKLVHLTILASTTGTHGASDYSTHTIVIRYSDTWAWERYQRFFAQRQVAGFTAVLDKDARIRSELKDNEGWYALMILMVGGMAALCLLHINLLIFCGGREHLLYSIFTGGIVIYFSVRVAERWIEYNVELLTWLLAAHQYFLVGAFIACVGFFYAIFSTKRPVGIWIIAFSPAILFWGGAVIPFLARGDRTFLVFMGIIFADIMRIIVRAIIRKQRGAWLLGMGGVFFIVPLAIQILAEQKLIPFPIAQTGGLLVLISFFSIPLAMSIYLSQSIAATNKELAQKLVEVEQLTDKTIAQEVERQVLQADNDRKTRELEEARQLQLSMLPHEAPNVKGLDIAMYMQTATEVGGDYYDYFIDNEGALTIAIGDATGHGVKAGTMVAATKSLFAVMAQDATPANTLKPTSPALKRMNLKAMFMALMVVKIKNCQGVLANAGMPSALLYRAATQELEEIVLKSMPLGTMANFPYQERQFILESGDALILMSDGFPERFNAHREILGYDTAQIACSALGDMSAQEIVNHLVRTSEHWAQGTPLNDDMTFVVVRAE